MEFDLHGLTFVEAVGRYPEQAAMVMQKQAMELTKLTDNIRMAEISALLRDAVNTDGGHHKQWFLEEVASRLGVALPPHQNGIAP